MFDVYDDRHQAEYEAFLAEQARLAELKAQQYMDYFVLLFPDELYEDIC